VPPTAVKVAAAQEIKTATTGEESNGVNYDQSKAKCSSFHVSDLQIIYATVTGCAQGVAEDVAKKAAAQGWNPTCCAIDKVDMDMFAKQKAALFIVSTTGDGDTPDCARTFLRHLRKNKDNTQLLAAVNYSVRAALTQHSSQRQRARF
jgi:sulfite reductase alpha subunit-like flavoprotein